MVLPDKVVSLCRLLDTEVSHLLIVKNRYGEITLLKMKE
jgi:hypothetical protein